MNFQFFTEFPRSQKSLSLVCLTSKELPSYLNLLQHRQLLFSCGLRQFPGLQKDKDRGTKGPKEGFSQIGRFGLKGHFFVNSCFSSTIQLYGRTKESDKHLKYILMVLKHIIKGFV